MNDAFYNECHEENTYAMQCWLQQAYNLNFVGEMVINDTLA